MTPDHQKLIEDTLQLAYARAIEWQHGMAIPMGKNPPPYTTEMLWSCPLAHDLAAIANYVEGYAPTEDITAILARIARTLFGQTLSKTTIRLPHTFHQTPLGEMMFAAFARYFPSNAWMSTAEVQRLFQIKRQTVYDWAEEDKLAAYWVNGKQVYLRQQIETYHARWLRRKQRKGMSTPAE
jgi:Helix-turn-helix domain